jgi:hypothetical protein
MTQSMFFPVYIIGSVSGICGKKFSCIELGEISLKVFNLIVSVSVSRDKNIDWILI